MPRAPIGEIELEYEAMGSADAAPLLLINGLGAQLVSWDDTFCEVLTDSGYRVIRYDNRDSGLSTILDGRGVPDLLGLLLGGKSAPYVLDDMVDDAIGLLDHLAVERAHVMGLSLGGMISQLLALRCPDRVSSVVAALSGLPGRPAVMPSPDVVEALLRTPGASFEERVASAVALRRALAGDGVGFDETDARRRAAFQIRRAHRPEGTMRQAAAVLATPNRLTDLAALAPPAMIVHGELDPLIPFSSAQAAAVAIPKAEFVGILGLGHDLPAPVALDLIERVTAFHASLDRIQGSRSGSQAG